MVAGGDKAMAAWELRDDCSKYSGQDCRDCDVDVAWGVCGVGHEPGVRASVLDAVRGHGGLTVLGLHGEPGSRAGERVVTGEVHATEADDASSVAILDFPNCF